jgi:uncharacterized protein
MKEYKKIVDDILTNEEFKKLDKIEHHGTSRMEHSISVSYKAYTIAKKINLNEVEVARAGLLHDFFLSEENRTRKEKIASTFTHPPKAVEHTKKYFTINEKEENIIKSHMFPFYKTIPKYKESWLVSMVDKAVGFKEFSTKYKYRLSYANNLVAILVLNLFYKI